jgi:prepilin-type N-terminal cleavage/methylation domain-containing protein
MNKSFTLIEILVVIVIIGILSGFIIVSMAGVSSKATIAKGQVFANSLKNALLINLLAQYKLDGDASDSWGGHAAGTVSGASSYSSCVQGTCYNFDGVDDYIELADSSDLRMASGGTISAWIYPKTLGEGSVGRIVHKGTDINATNGYRAQVSSSNTLRFVVNAGAVQTVSSNDAVKLNQWQLVTISFNGSGRKLYVNGIDVTSAGGSETALPPDVAGIVRIGNNTIATDTTFDGYMDEVSIYNAAVPTSQIQESYYAGLSRLLAGNWVGFEEYRERTAELRESIALHPVDK